MRRVRRAARAPAALLRQLRGSARRCRQPCVSLSRRSDQAPTGRHGRHWEWPIPGRGHKSCSGRLLRPAAVGGSDRRPGRSRRADSEPVQVVGNQGLPPPAARARRTSPTQPQSSFRALLARQGLHGEAGPAPDQEHRPGRGVQGRERRQVAGARATSGSSTPATSRPSPIRAKTTTCCTRASTSRRARHRRRWAS